MSKLRRFGVRRNTNIHKTSHPSTLSSYLHTHFRHPCVHATHTHTSLSHHFMYPFTRCIRARSSSHNNNKVIEFSFLFRLLVCGGAKVDDLKLPVKNAYATSHILTYMFVDRKTAPLAKDLLNMGVMVVDADYISDCVILVSD